MRVLLWLGVSSLLTSCLLVTSLDGLEGPSSGTAGLSGTAGTDTTVGGSSGAAGNGGQLGDASPQGPFPVIVDRPIAIYGIAVTSTDLYWVEGPSGGVYRASTGGNGADAVRLVMTLNAFDVAVDDAYLYWTEGNSLWRQARADGSAAMQWPGGGHTQYLAVGGLGRVYISNSFEGNIVVFNGVRSDALYLTEPQASGMAADGENIFWARGAPVGLRQGSATGSQPFDLPPLTDVTRITGVAADATYVYWIEDNIRVKKLRRNPTTLPGTVCQAPQEIGDGNDIVVDAEWVYFSEPANHRISKCRR